MGTGHPFAWPSFVESAWTATFASYDQRLDNAYYFVTLAARPGSVHTVRVGVEWAGDDWRAEEFAARLRREVADAVAGLDP